MAHGLLCELKRALPHLECNLLKPYSNHRTFEDIEIWCTARRYLSILIVSNIHERLICKWGNTIPIYAEETSVLSRHENSNYVSRKSIEKMATMLAHEI